MVEKLALPKLAPTVVLGFCDISGAGTRALAGLQACPGVHDDGPVTFHLQSASDLLPVFKKATKGRVISFPICEARSFSGGGGGQSAQVTLLTLNTAIPLTHAVRVALELVEALVQLGVKKVILASSLPLKGKGALGQAASSNKEEEDESEPVFGGEGNPLDPSVSLVDDFVCVFHELAGLLNLPLQLLACHGHSMRDENPFRDGTYKAVNGLGHAICASLGGQLLRYNRDVLHEIQIENQPRGLGVQGGGGGGGSLQFL